MPWKITVEMDDGDAALALYHKLVQGFATDLGPGMFVETREEEDGRRCNVYWSPISRAMRIELEKAE